MFGIKTLSTYCKLYKLTTRTLNVKSLAPFLRHFPQYNHRVSISSGTRTLCTKSNDDALKSAQKTCTLHKGVIEVSGVDMVGFLQGIVTNDVNCLAEHSCEAMYSYILNPQGRIMYDLFIYSNKKFAESDKPLKFYIECDNQVTNELLSTLKRYKLRKKVLLSDRSSDISVLTHFSSSGAVLMPGEQSDIICSSEDPRHSLLGVRTLCDKLKVSSATDHQDPSHYTQHLYSLGVGEGIESHIPGKTLPLESNAHFLNGVAFSKGCYIGQELTARTHHTGVIRKRLMPLKFDSPIPAVMPGDKIKTPSGARAGVFLHNEGTYGLGLLRVSEVIGQPHLVVANEQNEKCYTHIPEWWRVDEDEIIKKAVEKIT